MWPRVALFMAVAVFLLLPTERAEAATITVNTTADVVADDGQCSLREAITAANNNAASGSTVGECPAGSGADTITLPAGTYTLTLGSELTINSSTTLSGAGAATTIAQATTTPGVGDFRIFHITGGYVPISTMTIRHGKPPIPDFGGGIFNEGGTLSVSEAVVTQNYAEKGGGISSANGTTTVVKSTITDNEARIDGGGIFSDNSNLVLSPNPPKDGLGDSP